MPVLFKRNSLSSMGGGTVDGQTTAATTVTISTTQPPHQKGINYGGRQLGMKRPPELSPNEKILALKSQTQGVKLNEKKRQHQFHEKTEAARTIQLAWRRYYKRRNTVKAHKQFEETSREAVRRKRLRATQAEWEQQIAALTIQLAWRKFYRRKLLRTLHPNRRQLLMWDPEVVALKQQALVNYIYNEQIEAPFWHPTLRAPVRPLWFRFIPSAAAVSYNFAVDQYVPWVARLGAQPEFPDDVIPGLPGPAQNRKQSKSLTENSSASSSRSHSSRSKGKPESRGGNRNSTSSKRSSQFSYNMKRT